MAKPIFDDESWSCSGIGSKTGPHFTDRARPGSKLHLVTEAQGIPLALILIGASRNGVTQPLPLIEAIAPIRGKRDGRCPSRLSCRPIVATIATNSKPLHAAGIAAQSARRGEPHGSGLNIRAGGVERSFAWLHNFRRLPIRFERLAAVHEALMEIPACVICWRQFRKTIVLELRRAP